MRSPALTALLARYGIEPCGDGSCILGSPGGQHTNGGCRCIGRTEGDDPASVELRRLVMRLGAIIRELDQQSEQIAAWLEAEATEYLNRDLHDAAQAVRAGRWKERG